MNDPDVQKCITLLAEYFANIHKQINSLARDIRQLDKRVSDLSKKSQ